MPNSDRTIASPQVRLVSIGGVAVPANSRGIFAPADLQINADQAVTIDLAAENIPIGTVINLRMFSETGGLIEINSTPLAGTLANSTATATATIPSGFSRFTVQASWTP